MSLLALAGARYKAGLAHDGMKIPAVITQDVEDGQQQSDPRTICPGTCWTGSHVRLERCCQSRELCGRNAASVSNAAANAEVARLLRTGDVPDGALRPKPNPVNMGCASLPEQ